MKKELTLFNLDHFDTKANKFLESCHNFRVAFATKYALWQVKWLRRADGFQHACLPKYTQRVRSPLCEFSGRSCLAEVLLHCSPLMSKEVEKFVHGCCYRTDMGHHRGEWHKWPLVEEWMPVLALAWALEPSGLVPTS